MGGDSYHMWRGRLWVGSRDLGLTSLWSNKNMLIPAIGGDLKLTSFGNYQDLWERLIVSDPFDISEGSLDFNEMNISVFRLEGHSPFFSDLATELVETNEPRILIGELYNPGRRIHVVLVPHCPEAESVGLTKKEDESDPYLHALFISSVTSEKAKEMYRQQRDIQLQKKRTKSCDKRACPFMDRSSFSLPKAVKGSGSYLCINEKRTNQMGDFQEERGNSQYYVSKGDSYNISQDYLSRGSSNGHVICGERSSSAKQFSGGLQIGTSSESQWEPEKTLKKFRIEASESDLKVDMENLKTSGDDKRHIERNQKSHSKVPTVKDSQEKSSLSHSCKERNSSRGKEYYKYSKVLVEREKERSGITNQKEKGDKRKTEVIREGSKLEGRKHHNERRKEAKVSRDYERGNHEHRYKGRDWEDSERGNREHKHKGRDWKDCERGNCEHKHKGRDWKDCERGNHKGRDWEDHERGKHKHKHKGKDSDRKNKIQIQEKESRREKRDSKYYNENIKRLNKLAGFNFLKVKENTEEVKEKGEYDNEKLKEKFNKLAGFNFLKVKEKIEDVTKKKENKGSVKRPSKDKISEELTLPEKSKICGEVLLMQKSLSSQSVSLSNLTNKPDSRSFSDSQKLKNLTDGRRPDILEKCSDGHKEKMASSLPDIVRFGGSSNFSDKKLTDYDRDRSKKTLKESIHHIFKKFCSPKKEHLERKTVGISKEKIKESSSDHSLREYNDEISRNENKMGKEHFSSNVPQVANPCYRESEKYTGIENVIDVTRAKEQTKGKVQEIISLLKGKRKLEGSPSMSDLIPEKMMKVVPQDSQTTECVKSDCMLDCSDVDHLSSCLSTFQPFLTVDRVKVPDNAIKTYENMSPCRPLLIKSKEKEKTNKDCLVKTEEGQEIWASDDSNTPECPVEMEVRVVLTDILKTPEYAGKIIFKTPENEGKISSLMTDEILYPKDFPGEHNEYDQTHMFVSTQSNGDDADDCKVLNDKTLMEIDLSQSKENLSSTSDEPQFICSTKTCVTAAPIVDISEDGKEIRCLQELPLDLSLRCGPLEECDVEKHENQERKKGTDASNLVIDLGTEGDVVSQNLPASTAEKQILLDKFLAVMDSDNTSVDKSSPDVVVVNAGSSPTKDMVSETIGVNVSKNQHLIGNRHEYLPSANSNRICNIMPPPALQENLISSSGSLLYSPGEVRSSETCLDSVSMLHVLAETCDLFLNDYSKSVKNVGINLRETETKHSEHILNKRDKHSGQCIDQLIDIENSGDCQVEEPSEDISAILGRENLSYVPLENKPVVTMDSSGSQLQIKEENKTNTVIDTVCLEENNLEQGLKIKDMCKSRFQLADSSEIQIQQMAGSSGVVKIHSVPEAEYEPSKAAIKNLSDIITKPTFVKRRSQRTKSVVGDSQEDMKIRNEIDQLIINKILALTSSEKDQTDSQCVNNKMDIKRAEKPLSLKEKLAAEDITPIDASVAVITPNKSFRMNWDEAAACTLKPLEFDSEVKRVHLLRGNPDDVSKLKLLGLRHALTYSTEQEVRDMGGCIYIRPELIGELCALKPLRKMSENPAIRFAVYSSLMDILKGLGRPILMSKWILVVHHTSMLDSGLEKLLEAVRRDHEVNAEHHHEIFITASTLKICFLSVSGTRKSTDKEKKAYDVVLKNLYCLISCINSGVGKIIDGESWKKLGPESSIRSFISCLKTMHLSLKYSHRHLAVLVGEKNRSLMKSEGEFYMTATAKHVVSKISV